MELYLCRGKIYANRDMDDAVIEEFNKILAKHPDNFKAVYERASAN